MLKKRNRDKRVPITIIMPPKLVEQLDALCIKDNRSRSNFTVELIRDGLAKRGVAGYDG